MGLFRRNSKTKKSVVVDVPESTETPRSESTGISDNPTNAALSESLATTPRSLISDTTSIAPSQAPVPASVAQSKLENQTPRSNHSDQSATKAAIPASTATSKANNNKTRIKSASSDGPPAIQQLTPRSSTFSEASEPTQTGIPPSVNGSKLTNKLNTDKPKLGQIQKAKTNTSTTDNKLKPKLSQIRKKSANKTSDTESERALGERTSSVYIPPSKLLKHLDPDSKSFRKKEKKGVSHQVNRLLKQNTQELFGSLTPEVRKAFETLFDRIDVTDSGGITAKEIQQLIKKHTGKMLTVNQVKEVLCELDVKGTGDIEFDEFIFMLSQPSNYVRLLDKRDLKGLKGKETQKYLEQKQKQDETDTTYVFFEALRNATKQDSMTALRTFYKNRLKKLNDHVIHDWSAGQRCIGLSDQEMLKRYETIQGELLRQRVNFCKDNSYKQSPYARPLEWGVMNLREAILARRRLACESKQPKPDPRRVKMSEFVVTPKAVPLPRYVIKKRSPLKRTFNYDQLADIRDKVDNIANKYYNDLKQVAGENSTVVQKELAVDEIRSPASQANFMHTFEAYCAPFVVSPWIPMPSPTLQASFSPLGRSNLTMKSDVYQSVALHRTRTRMND